MAPGDDSFEAMMAELRQEFLSRMSVDQVTLAQAWSDAQEPASAPRALETLAFLAHRLAGLGRTFGYQAITDMGIAVEGAVEAQRNQAGTLSPKLEQSIVALQKAIDAALS